MHHQPTLVLVVIDDSPFDITDVDPEHITTLGELPPRTHSDRVAHPRSGFIDPTATAGGDALPITHSIPDAVLGPMASTQDQPQPRPHSFNANNHSATAAVAVMIGVVLAMAAIALDAAVTGSADLLAGTAVVAAGFVGLVGPTARPTLRWAVRYIAGQVGQDGGKGR